MVRIKQKCFLRYLEFTYYAMCTVMISFGSCWMQGEQMEHDYYKNVEVARKRYTCSIGSKCSKYTH